MGNCAPVYGYQFFLSESKLFLKNDDDVCTKLFPTTIFAIQKSVKEKSEKEIFHTEKTHFF
jgi:hypothetical protein